MERAGGPTTAAALRLLRFAREASRAALEHGIVVRSAIAAGEGELFEDVSGRPGVACPAAQRAAELLAKLGALPADRPALALDGASPLIALAAHAAAAGLGETGGRAGGSGAVAGRGRRAPRLTFCHSVAVAVTV